jgi:hypothetical protein
VECARINRHGVGNAAYILSRRSTQINTDKKQIFFIGVYLRSSAANNVLALTRGDLIS